MSKIYIIGPVGSGKTTLAKKISQDLNIKYYELDYVIFNKTDKGDIKRTSEEITKIFNKIINTNNWIIEDVGRDIFKDAYDKADILIFINISRFLIYKRLFLRWIKQILKMEYSSYKPNIKMLMNMFKWANNGIKNSKLKKIMEYKNKLIILDNQLINNYKEIGEILCKKLK